MTGTEQSADGVKLSIVATMYKSAPYIREFCSRCVAAASRITDDFEIILVNDGSPDDSLEIALDMRAGDPRIKIVDFSRNFGHHKAMMTGLMHVSGEQVFLIDSDLEEPPELLLEFWELLEKDRALDVVYGVQERRKGGWFERWGGRAFFTVMKVLSRQPLPSDVVTARLMTRRYVDALTQHLDREVFMLGLWEITGFKQMGVKVNKASKGETTYTLFRKLSVALNAITSFSNRPLYFIFAVGMVMSACSFCLALYYLLLWFFVIRGNETGFTTIVISIWMVGGLNLLSQGMLGIYLAKMFSEVKRRPYTVIRELHFDGKERDGGR